MYRAEDLPNTGKREQVLIRVLGPRMTLVHVIVVKTSPIHPSKCLYNNTKMKT
jgi:hypothetical protein